VPGIDVILCGHSHQVFPSDTYKDIPDADLTKGLIKGVPTVMAGFWGSHVGVVDLDLKRTASGWTVASGTATARQVKTTLAAADFEPDVRQAIADDHQATLAYLQTAVGETQNPIDSYFSIAMPSLAVQVVADGQAWYVKQQIAQGGSATAALVGLPVLSASAPLNAGQTPTAYTDVPAGQVTLRHLADLYVYPNTVEVVKLSGAQVVEWLEMAAQVFNRIKPDTGAEQPLVNGKFPEYNFDQLIGLEYTIDVSQAPRYDKGGKLLNAGAHRITDVSYDGQPLDPNADFLVVTNNYRAFGGGNFPGLDASRVVLDPSYESREAVRDYVVAAQTIGTAVTPTWTLKPVPGATNVTFASGPEGKAHLDETGGLVSYVGDAPGGYAKYKLNWN
jgi:2',3'-cyclic-nucleotide 2'-phosphodiesterase/3'-nucleotidase